jgi:hypothetical protein
MERYCGSLLPAITSRKNPFRSIDRREREMEQLRMLKLRYNLAEELDLSASAEDFQRGVKLVSRQ